MLFFSNATTTAGSTATSSARIDLNFENYLYIEARAEQYQRRSNEQADLAMLYACAGKEATAHICAAFADELALLARVIGLFDSTPTGEVSVSP